MWYLGHFSKAKSIFTMFQKTEVVDLKNKMRITQHYSLHTIWWQQGNGQHCAIIWIFKEQI